MSSVWFLQYWRYNTAAGVCIRAESQIIIHRFLLQEGKSFLNVAPVLKHSSASLPTLQNTSRQSLGWFVELSAAKLDVQSRTERRLTTRWPLITSSRSNSLEPSRKSLNRSMTMQGGLRCHSTQTQTQTHFMLLSLIYVSKSMERFVLNVFLTEFCEASAEGRPPCDTESKLIS